jgi:hypothetical protein
MTCDSDGDIFLQFVHYDPARLWETDPGVSEVIPDSKRIVAYGTSPLSQFDYPNSRLESFSVLPNGEVYALIFTRRDRSSGGPRPAPEYYVERFKDDGTTDSITHIDAPPGAAHWSAALLGAYWDGNFLIAGTSSGSAEQPGASSWRPFTAIYGPRGRFVSEVTLPEDIVNDFAEGSGPAQRTAGAAAATPAGTAGGQLRGGEKAAAESRAETQETQASSTKPSKPHEFFEISITTGGLISAPDGNIWIFRASDPIRLYAVSSAGEVIKHFQFPAPVSGLKPSKIGSAGPARIFLDFAHFAGDPIPPSGSSHAVGVFDPLSERFETLYTLPDTDKSFRVLACGDGRGGFLYLGSTPDNHVAVFDYGP